VQSNPLPPQRSGLTAIDGAMSLVVILLIVQMWLLTSALEASLAGHKETALPASIISGVILGACVCLYRFVDHVDSEVRKTDGIDRH
jgi:hypothetical protein